MSNPTYASYLALDELLGCLRPASDHPDERLFIILHQTKELWLRQILEELDAAQTRIETGELTPAYKNLARVSRIQAVMTLSWDVLATMTPTDYTSFRSVLGTSSGFQSDQFRMMEYRLGLKDGAFLKYQDDRPDAQARMSAALEGRSLYDAVIVRLALAGFPISDGVLNRDVSQAYQPSVDVEDAWLSIYTDTARWWELYQLAEKLVDLDDALLTWRQKHATTVERIIGQKRGTGGTDGVGYLKATFARRCFPELWSVRTRM